jgi:hypothetical protein
MAFVKIRSSGLGGSTLQPGQGSGTPVLRSPQHPVGVLLFGKRAPKLVDKRKFPKLKKGLKRLEDMTEHIALLVGRNGEREFDLQLCEGDNASISRDGQIAFGVDLLDAHQENDDLLLAVLGHEIGHQPWSWPGGSMASLSKSALEQMYREEEAKADVFAGRVLAEMGGSTEAIEAFLRESAKGFEAKQNNEYYPVEVRIEMIRKSFQRRKRMLNRASALLHG